MVYYISYVVPHTNYQIANALQALGIVLMFTTGIGLAKLKFDSDYLRVIYVLYCGWLLYVIWRGIGDLADFDYLKLFLFEPFEGMLYFTPLILLFPPQFCLFKKFFDVITLFGIFYLILTVVFIKSLLTSELSGTTNDVVESFSNVAFSCGFILLTLSYHKRKRQIIATLVVMLALLFAVIRARRGLTFMYGYMVLISFILFFFHSRAKILIITLTLCIGMAGALYISGTEKIGNIKILQNFVERVDEDTRSYVENSFYNDMKEKDWIIGKGLSGVYFCPGVGDDPGVVYRRSIETGYLTTILKGGFISLGLLLLIAVPAIVNGLFYSNNILSKAAAIWILMSQINSYPGTTNAFTLTYLLVWVCIRNLLFKRNPKYAGRNN